MQALEVPCNTPLQSTLYCPHILHCIALHYTLQYSALPPYPILHCTVLHCNLQCSEYITYITSHSTIMLQYSIVHCPHILQTQEARLGFSPLLPLSSLPRYCCIAITIITTFTTIITTHTSYLSFFLHMANFWLQFFSTQKARKSRQNRFHGKTA